MTGPLISSLSFTAQTVETSNTTVKPAKTDELVAGGSTCSHLISA